MSVMAWKVTCWANCGRLPIELEHGLDGGLYMSRVGLHHPWPRWL